MIESISLLGSSSGRNAGDAALIAGIMSSIDQACGRRLLFEIPTFRPEFIWRSYENRVRPISMLPWSGTAGMLGIPTARSLVRTDMTLIYDAMLFDKKLYNPLFNYMSTAWLMLPWAKRKNKILGCYNIGAGPVNTPQGQKMLKEIGNMMDFITVRDEDSLNLLREIGVTNENILLTADAAISVPASPEKRIDALLAEVGFQGVGEFLAINVNTYLNTWAGTGQDALTPDVFAAIYGDGLTRVVEELNIPVLFVCTQHSDIPITKKIMERLPKSAKTGLFTNLVYGHHDIKGVLSRASLLFAMRLHANILATSAYTPSISLAFQKKVTSWYKRLDLESYVMSFNDFSAETIYRHLIRGWNDRAKIKENLKQHIPFLLAEADKAAQLVAAIDRGEDPGSVIRRLSTGQTASSSRAVNG